MSNIKKTTQAESAHIKRRLLKCLPASRFEMQTITRLANIVATRAVPTASVECKRHPRMLINPDFVKDNCKHDEHLFMLVMHELWHVLLAHTRMYPFSTKAHNIAFDAIINSGLAAKFPTPEYTSFFTKMYPADEFPMCLLRPPEGWPHNPVYPDVGPPGTKAILERLYPRNNYRPFFQQSPLYEEVLALLVSSGMNFEVLPIPLLGNHDDQPRNPDGSPVNDPFMKDALKKIAKDWPQMKMDGQGFGGRLGEWQVRVAPDYENARRAFSNVLKKALSTKVGREYRRAKMPVQSVGGTAPLINMRDRTHHARRKLGDNSLLYTQPTEIQARVPERPALAHVYLDVSGSMNRLLPHVIGLLIPYAMQRQISIFQFSTEVTYLKVENLREGKLTTTGGTNINCVLQHIVEHEQKIGKVLLLTDGAVGAPRVDLRSQFEELGVTMHAVLPWGCTMDRNTAPLLRSIVKLPAPGRRH